MPPSLEEGLGPLLLNRTPSDSLGTTHETATKVRLCESRPVAALTILTGSLTPRALSVTSTPAKEGVWLSRTPPPPPWGSPGHRECPRKGAVVHSPPHGPADSLHQLSDLRKSLPKTPALRHQATPGPPGPPSWGPQPAGQRQVTATMPSPNSWPQAQDQWGPGHSPPLQPRLAFCSWGWALWKSPPGPGLSLYLLFLRTQQTSFCEN